MDPYQLTLIPTYIYNILFSSMYWWYVSKLRKAVMLHTFGKWILDIMNNDSSCTCYIMYNLVLSSNVLNSL